MTAAEGSKDTSKAGAGKPPTAKGAAKTGSAKKGSAKSGTAENGPAAGGVDEPVSAHEQLSRLVATREIIICSG